MLIPKIMQRLKHVAEQVGVGSIVDEKRCWALAGSACRSFIPAHDDKRLVGFPLNISADETSQRLIRFAK